MSLKAADRAKAIVDAIDGGVVVDRPARREATVLRCNRCLVRFSIVQHRAAEQIQGPCRCGGLIRIIGYYARLEPRNKEAKRA